MLYVFIRVAVALIVINGTTVTAATLLTSVSSLWVGILRAGILGPDDDFFAQGGHSIAAAHLFALIQRELGYAAPLATLYDASTPRLVARILRPDNKKPRPLRTGADGV
jgi:hypothetical protein